jgi:hypothetical protein
MSASIIDSTVSADKWDKVLPTKGKVNSTINPLDCHAGA